MADSRTQPRRKAAVEEYTARLSRAPRRSAATSDRLSAALEFRPWLEAVARTSAAVNNMEPLSNVLNAIAAVACGLLGYDFGAVLLADGDRLYMRGAHGLARNYVDTINSEKPRFDLAMAPSAKGLPAEPSGATNPWWCSTTVAIHQSARGQAWLPSRASRPWWRCRWSSPDVPSGRSTATPARSTTSARTSCCSWRRSLTRRRWPSRPPACEKQERATIARLETARRSLEQQTAILERSEQIHSQLTQAVLDDAGLPAIADALTRVLSGSVVIEDGASMELATAAFGDVPPKIPAAVLHDAELMERLSLRLAARAPIELLPEDHVEFDPRALVAPVVIGREIVGRLWVLGVADPFDALEQRALEHGATVVAIELLKQRIASEVGGRLSGELLGDLIGNRALDPIAARVSAGHLGHDLSVRQTAMVVAFDAHDDQPARDEPGGTRNRQLESLVGLLVKRTHADALVGQIEGRLVLLLGESPKRGPRVARELADAIRREVNTYMQGTTVTVAFGPWCDGIAEYGRSYRIARGAAELSQRFGQPDRTVSAEALGVQGLLLSVDRLDELFRFSRETLGPLHAYDAKRNTDLVGTLRTYLANNCRSSATSEALVVHPNTVAYRIRRIETLLGLDLGRPASQLQVELALSIQDIATGDSLDAQTA